MLATDESHHAQMLRNRKNRESNQLEDSGILLDTKNIFNESNDIKSDDKLTPSQLDFYRIAAEKEKQSIDLYTDLLSKAEQEEDNKIFEYLIAQEKQHAEVLEYAAIMLQHAEEWVESAEFGIRKEY